MHGIKSWIGWVPALGLLTFLAGGYDDAAKAGPGACEPAQTVPVCEPVQKITVKPCEPVKQAPKVPVCEPVKKLAAKPKACEPVKEQWTCTSTHGPVALVLDVLDHLFGNRVVVKTEYYPAPPPAAAPLKTTPAQLPPPPKAPTATTLRS